MSAKRLTIRFNADEWTELEHKAAGRPVSTYARKKLLGAAAKKRQPQRRPQANDVLLARILAALGSSDLSKNMRDIAEGIRTGTVPDAENLAQTIHTACLTIEKIRRDQIRALGIKPE